MKYNNLLKLVNEVIDIVVVEKMDIKECIKRYNEAILLKEA